MSVISNTIVNLLPFLSILDSENWYVTFGFITSKKSPVIVVSAFVLFDVSFTFPAATFMATVPLQSLYSLFLSIVVLVFSKFVSVIVYWCPITLLAPFTVSFISVGLLNVLLTLEAVSESTNTVISFAVSFALVLKYLSITLNVIVSVPPDLPDDTFSIFGFIKSTWPIVNDVSGLEFELVSVSTPAAIVTTVLPLHSK